MSQPLLTPIAALPWLSKLKASQLHRIAVATGVQSSGTKAVLVQRLNDELQSSYNDGIANPAKTKQARKRDAEGFDQGREMSILSIDMGIRNLAYAHIIVPPRREAKVSTRNFGGVEREDEAGFPSPVLNAWSRLAVSSFPTSSTSTDTDSCLNASTTSSEKSRQTLAENQVNTLTSGHNIEAKESFSPDLYASHAYSLITSLLATYKPTHILIERQRFRSGGSSAVLEWTIRVGVFEGMLYAVLNTLRREGRIKGLVGEKSDVDVVVKGVEPKRVATYWTESSLGSSKERGEGIGAREEGNAKEKKSGKAPRSKDVKKVKINLVANWWLSFLEHQNSQAGDRESLKISLAKDSRAKEVVDAYLQKWKGGNSSSERARGRSGKKEEKGTIRKGSRDEHLVAKIKKLDDLADCLLQGIAWLEWTEMRMKLARDGLQAVPWLRDTGSSEMTENDDTKTNPATRRRRSKNELK